MSDGATPEELDARDAASARAVQEGIALGILRPPAAPVPGRDATDEQAAALADVIRDWLHEDAGQLTIPQIRQAAQVAAAAVLAAGWVPPDTAAALREEIKWLWVKTDETRAALATARADADAALTQWEHWTRVAATARAETETMRSALAWMVGAHYARPEDVPRHVRSALEATP